MILAIESSCDDSSIAVMDIDTKELLFCQKISQESQHKQYGGVVPELASRLHLEALPNILKNASRYFPQIRAVAVTNAPGLSVTLNEGIMMAKALSISLNVPLIGVNHLIGHIYSLFINRDFINDIMVLLVSGGHTKILYLQDDYRHIKELASTIDDSFGESFDKVAKMLNLGYPGGPIIESLAQQARPTIPFPIPLKQSKEIKFSYSGLKNAVRLAINQGIYSKEEIAASFQQAAITHLTMKLNKLFKTTQPPKHFAVVGGASANRALREEIDKLASKYKFDVLYPQMKYCSDNAAMIARIGVDMYHNQDFTHYKDLQAISKVSFDTEILS
ncbi:MAG: tRNA (adenosine(37)-N6)-threonylcarbamoyltransferase complex transferase subunit TsaD [Epsilonproteobacteria bacterium]|nr:tRNA (adenosine(37)-N6)-threonylcarbamoyltransferase complex transferase subunit TsaD [Campylobacterota bacterium]